MKLLYLIENRVTSTKLITILFLILGLIISPKLWVGNRRLPLVPVIDILENVPHSFNYFLFLLLIIFLLFEVLKPNKWSLISTILILFYFILQDQNRLQPWVYIYILFLLPFCFLIFFKNPENSLSNLFKIILIAIYFWSGIQKINSNFINDGFSHILITLFRIQDTETIKNILPLGYIIPIIEILTAICLLFKILRKYGIALAIITHTFILIYTSPIGINNNYIVAPWNVAMILLVITTFYEEERVLELSNRIDFKIALVNYLYLLILGLLPLLNFFDKWDDYLSFSLYSEKNKVFYIAISDKYIAQFNHQFDDYFLQLDANIQGGKVIDVNRWSMKELNVPIYPEERLFKKISKDFCQYNIPNTDIMFLMYKGSIQNDNLIKWTCTDK